MGRLSGIAAGTAQGSPLGYRADHRAGLSRKPRKVMADLRVYG